MTRPQRPPSPCRGYKLKGNETAGWREYWEVSEPLRKLGYKPAVVRLHYDDTPAGRAACAAKCERLTAEAMLWKASGGQFPQQRYDGTIAGIARLYELDPDSPMQRMKWTSRRTALQTLGVVVKSVGKRRVDAVTGHDVKRWHRLWGEPAEGSDKPRPHRARGAIDRLRQIIGFGVIMGLPDCEKLDRILGKLRFDGVAPRTQKLDVHQVAAIRAEAHRQGYPSMALAQVLMFETTLRETDVIGQWAPGLTPGGIVHMGRHWEDGLLWSDLSPDMILTKRTSKTGVTISFDLKELPEVLAELAHFPPERRVGPMLINERTSLPWRRDRFQVVWRRLATAIGVPREIQARDSRPGGITEALEAGATPAEVAKLTGHKKLQTLEIYDRSGDERRSKVQRLRASKRMGNASDRDA